MARLDDIFKEVDANMARARRLRAAVEKENPTVKEPPEEPQEETLPEASAEEAAPEPAATTFEVGEVVTMRSGSGGMTVVALQPDDYYDLMFWVENDGRLATVRLPGACLERY